VSAQAAWLRQACVWQRQWIGGRLIPSVGILPSVARRGSRHWAAVVVDTLQPEPSLTIDTAAAMHDPRPTPTGQTPRTPGPPALGPRRDAHPQAPITPFAPARPGGSYRPCVD